MLWLRYYLWIAPHVLLSVFLVLFLLKGARKRFPIFCGYVIAELAEFLAALAIRLHSPFSTITYRWVVNVLGDGTCALIGLGVVYELANELVFARSSLASLLRRTLKVVLAVLVLVAAVGSGALADISVYRVTNIFEVLDFSSNLILAGILVALLASSRVLGIAWRSLPAGLVLGFGISASINLASAALRSAFGKVSIVPVDITQMAAFHLCVVIWLVYLLLSECAPEISSGTLKASGLDQWSEELQGMVRR
jgi:hypothetical protein